MKIQAGSAGPNNRRVKGRDGPPAEGASPPLVEDASMNGALRKIVARLTLDHVTTLADHLKPVERLVLRGLADGLVLREIAINSGLSYPTTLKYRRKIAALTVKLLLAPLALAGRARR